MLYPKCQNNINREFRSGIVLMMTMVLLTILSILAYTLVSRLAAQKHRDQYTIDYQTARYACDSAIKYALVAITDVNASKLISRPNEPDFSDLFNLDQVHYDQMLADWAKLNPQTQTQTPNDTNTADLQSLTALEDLGDINDDNSLFLSIDANDANQIIIPGPYGPPWPYVTEPLEFQIGSAKVKIVIEDENAKYPLTWALISDKQSQREAQASLETFCEWMQMDRTQIEALGNQLSEVSSVKTFNIDLKLDQPAEKTAARPQQASPSQVTGRSRVARNRRSRRAISQTPIVPPIVHFADFANLFHSPLVDLETLAKPNINAGQRQESALKYLGIWASKTVNVNTAPRNVLEAAFTFGGDAEKIADEIIRKRKIKPFESIEQLQKNLLRYSTSIKKCEKYITTVSDFFTIRVTATCGLAKASAVIGVANSGKQMQKIAIIAD